MAPGHSIPVPALAGFLAALLADRVPQGCVDETAHLNWSEPANVGAPVNTEAWSEKSPDVSDDGLEIYFHRQEREPDQDGSVLAGLWVASRAATTDPWGEPRRLVNARTGDPLLGAQPCISHDKSMLYYTMETLGPSGAQLDIEHATRDPDEPQGNRWVPRGLVPGSVDTSDHDEDGPSISSDGKILYFSAKPLSSGSGEVSNHEIFHAVRSSPDEPFEGRLKDLELCDPNLDDVSPDLSADGDTIVFSRLSPPSARNPRVLVVADGAYIASRTRASLSSPVPRWCPPEKIIRSDSPSSIDRSPCLAGKDDVIYFRSTRPGGLGKSDLWMMTRPLPR